MALWYGWRPRARTSRRAQLLTHEYDWDPFLHSHGNLLVDASITLRDFNRETYARGRATFDETYAAFKTLLLGIWRRDELAAAEGAAAQTAPVGDVA